jgi:hypothetical protein
MRFALGMITRPLAWTRVLAGAPFVVALGVWATSLAQARPLYARQTGLACGMCHVDPAGGGPRTAFGRAFARNGHRLPGAPRHRHSGARGEKFEPRRDGMDRGMMGPGMMDGYGR